MSEGIANETVAVSIELILHGFENFRTLVHGLLHDTINIGKIDIEAYRASADSGGAGMSLPHTGVFVGQHDVRITDLQFSVSDLAVRAIHANGFRRAEHFFVIFNCLGSALDD